MKRLVRTFVMIGALALAGVPALAADTASHDQTTPHAQKQRLEEGYRAIARRTPATKLDATEQATRARQERAIKDLIRRLEAGENVAPSEVDRVLRVR